MAVVIADKAHTLGTADDLIDSSATSGLAAVVLSTGDTLTITGLTEYDTIAIKTGSGASQVRLVAATNTIQYSSDTGSTWSDIGTWDGGDGRTLEITFLSTQISITETIVDTLLQSLTIKADTAGTVADSRTLTYTFGGGTYTESDTSTYTLVGSANADTIIYSTGAINFNPLGGDDVLLVKSGMGALSLDMKTASQLEKFEVLNAAEANSAITLTLGSTVKTVTLGSAADTINIAAATDMGTVTVNGGAGRDTLNATAAVTLIDTDLAKLTSVEILTLSDNANSVTLGATNSIDTINGGSAIDTIDASDRTVKNATAGFYDLVINAGDGADIVTMSEGNDNIDLGAGDDTLKVASTNLTANDKIVGGDGADILEISDNTITDAVFAKISGMETIQTGDDAATSFVLGDKAFGAGIRTIDTSANSNTEAATIDLSTMTGDAAFTITAGTGDTIIKMTAANIGGTADTITGGAGDDTLEITTAGTIASGKLDAVTAVETLKLSSVNGNYEVTIADANDFTMIDATGATGNVTVDTSDETSAIEINTGSGADTITTGNGDTTIDSGDGNDIITAGTGANEIVTGAGDDIVNLGAGTDTVDVGAGTDTVNVDYVDFTSADTVTGSGDVTLQFTDAVDDGAATVESKMAGSGNSIDTIKLGADATQTVTLGTNAAAAGITTIDATALTSGQTLTADLTAFATTAVTVKGGADNDTVQMISADLTAATSIQGGLGDDILEITDEATVLDADFTLSTGLETLKLSATDAANTVTIGDYARAAGLKTVDAAANTTTKSQTVTVTMTNDADLTINTAAGADTIKMKGSQLTSGDFIDGGSATDTIEFTDIINVTDGAFTNVTSIEKIKLSAGDGQKLTLAAQAKEAGIMEVDASAAGSVTIDASGMSVLPLKITTAAGADTITLGSGVATVSSGAGNDTVKINTANLTSADTIDGGDGTDTLVILDAAALSDGSFTKVSNFEGVKLSDFNGQTVSLGSAAKAKNIDNIDASALTGTNSVTVTLDSNYNGATVKVTGGAGADTLKVTDGVITSGLTFIGGAGIDTIELTNAASIADADLAKVQEVEVIKLADDSAAQTITLGTNASGAGINKVDGSAMLANGSVTVNAEDMTNNMTITTVGGNDTITSGHGNDTISTGAGDDTIKIASEYFNSSDSIDGGANTLTGKDILEITSTNAAIADASFELVSNIELLRLSANSEYNLTLSTQAAANDIKNIEVTGSGGAKIDASGLGEAVTIKGGSGVETVTLGATDDVIDLAGGHDVIKLAAASLTSADSINMGDGTDIIEITTAETTNGLVDDDFSGVRNAETLKLTVDNTQKVVLGDKALNAGIRTVDASAMKTAGKTLTVDMSSMTSNVAMNVTGGYGNDTVKMKAGHLTSADTVTGDLGSDTIEFDGAVTLVDNDFTNVTGIETVKLSDADNQSIVLGEEARNGGQGVTTINASALTGTNKVTVDLSGMTTDQNMIVTTGAGADTIKTKAAQLTASDTLNGGAGTDTLEFVDQVNFSSSTMFGGVSNIETIKLSDATASNAQTLTLANSAVLNTVDASTITGIVTINGSAFTNALTITTGTGADVITVGSGANTVTSGDGDDKVIITSAALADGNADTLNGGVGSDTLEVTGTTAIADGKLSAITGFETIALTGSGDKSIAVGTNAKAGGVTTVDASTTSGANTINASAFNGTISLKGGSGVDTITAGTGSTTIEAGGGDDIITIDATTFDLNDTIDGGAGTDTLVLTGIANLSDANFTNVTGIEKLILADETGQVVVLGAEAKESGIRTIDTSAVATTKTVSLDISGMTSTNVTITGGAGNETVKMASADLTTADTITAGEGTDTLELTTASELVAADMTNISGFEKLKLANVDATQSLTLADAKFNEIDGSAITYTQAITIDASAQNGALSITTKGGADVITLGKGANTLDSGSGDDTIRITASTFDSSDTINAGNGVDTLEISGTAVVIDTMFDNVSGLETVKLTTDTTGQSVTLASTHAGNAGVKNVNTTLVNSSVSVDISGMGTGVTVETGSGADTITMGQGIDTIDSGGGNDTIKIASNYLTSADVINGGIGTNTLHITDKAVITDDMVVGVTNIDTLKLSDNVNAQTVTLGANAKTNNIVKVDSLSIAADHSLTLDISGLSAKNVTVTGGAGNETVKMAAADLTGADTISLGSGTDILEFTDAVNMTDTTKQAGLSGIDKIMLGDFATTLTLKDGIGSSLEVNAQAATGVKAAVIDISALGATTTTAKVYTSGGNDTITLGGSVNTVDTGAGDDIINISNANLINSSADTIDGGAGADKLRLTTAGTLTDTSLGSITNVEELVVTADSDQTLTVGANFANNGFTTVDASALTTGKLSLDITSAKKTGEVDIDVTVKGGGANDTITLDSTKLTATDTIDGNGGSDTLLIKNGAGSTITDAQFTLISEVETIKYAESFDHSLALGDLAKTAGIAMVDASALIGTAKLTLDVSSMGSNTALTIKGGAGNDEVTMLATHLTSADLLQLGTGVNTLKLSGADTLADSDFNGSNSGISKILYTQDQAQTIAVGSNMIGAGLGTIDATALSSAVATIDISAVTASFLVNTGGGADIITLGNGVVNINSGAGDDTIKTNGTYLTSADTINGGAGTDTLEITTADNLVDTDFTGVTNIETLKLSQNAAQSVVLGTEATEAGIVTINASAVTTATNVVTVDIQNMTSDKTMSITTGAGNDVIKLKGSHLTSTDTINGGDGTDTLEIMTADNLVDIDFTGVTNIETLKLSEDAAQNIVLGAEASQAGIVTVDASAVTTSSNAVTIDTIAMSSAAMTITTGAGDDLVRFKSGELTSADTVDGGDGDDTLEIAASSGTNTIADAAFANVANIETLKVTNTGGSNVVTFAAEAKEAGITTIDASHNNNGGFSTTFDFSTATADGDYILKGSAGADTIKIKSEHLTSADTINGGNNTDTIEFSTVINSSDETIFDGVSNVENILLAAGNDQKLTLNAFGNALTIDAKTNLTAANDKVTVDADLMTNNLTLNSAGGADTLIIGEGVDTIDLGAGDDVVKAKDGRLTSADTIKFGSGTDTLEMLEAATISDTDFTLVTGLEKIVLADGENSVTLGDLAYTAAVHTVDGSASSSAMTVKWEAQSDIGSGITVTGGAGDDTIEMKAGHLSANDVINGGDGTDILSLKGTGIVYDDVFVNKTSIETLKLDNADQDYTLGANAIAAGITSIDTTDVTTAKIRLDLSAMTTDFAVATKGGNDTIVMGSGEDTISTGAGDDTIRIAGDRLSAADSIDGEDGNDVLEFTSGISITDNATLGGVSNIETYKLANAADQVLTLKEDSALKTIDATALIGTNKVTVDATAMTTDLSVKTGNGNDTIIAGSGSIHTIDSGSGDDLIQFAAASDIDSSDSIKGGVGKDTLELTDTTAQTIDHTFFGSHISGIEVIKVADVTDHDINLSTATTAMASGLNTIDTTLVGATKEATINVSGFTTSMSVLGGAGNETVTAGKGVDTYSLGDGDDVLNIINTNWNKDDTISMGAGDDTLNVLNAALITDDMFTKVSGIEKMVLLDNTKDKTVTLGLNAKNSGLNEIDASALDTASSATAKKAVIDASLMTNGMTITTGTGYDTVTMGKGDDLISTGDGNDTIRVSSAHFTSSDEIDGGAGTDTLMFTDSATLADSSFTNVDNIEVIKLSDFDRQTVVLGDTALGKGILTVDASLLSAGNRSTIDFSTATSDETVSVTGGKGDDIIKMRAEDFTAADKIQAGTGIDTVHITTASSGAEAVSDDDFTLVTGLETLKLSDFDEQSVVVAAKAKIAGLKTIDATSLSGANSVTVDVTAMGGITVKTGSGNDTIKAGTTTAVDTIEAGSGNDTIEIKTSAFAGDVIDGGTGTDTILITDLATITDAKFSAVSNVEVLKVSDIAGTSTITLGTKADVAGIVSIDATLLSGSNKAVIDTAAMTGNVEIKTSLGDDVITLGSGVSTVTAGSGADTIKVAAAYLTSADSISGGLGADVLWMTTASTGGDAVADEDFTNTSGIETLKLSNFSSQTVTLGTNARLAGINTVDATAVTTSTFGVTIDTSTMSSSVTLKGGAGSDIFKLGTSNDTVEAGAGNDTIQLKSSDLTSFDTFDGGAGTDILEIIDAATVVDDDFTGISNLETLKLGDFASQTVSVGTKASVTTVGLKTIDASAVTTGSTVNASEATIGLTILGGSGNDTLLASKGANIIVAGNGNDTIKIASVGFDSSDKIDGGEGTDILEITDAANLIDSAWSNINGIETIKLNDFASQSIVLGTNAQTKGIVNINASGLSGTNSVTINTSAMTVNKDLNIQTGEGDDTFIVKKGFLDGSDTLKAGGGNDTLMFADAVTLEDAFFSTLHVDANFETIALSNFASQSVILGANAEAQGITTVDLSKVTTATSGISVTSSMDSGLNVIGGAGADTIVTSSGDFNDVISAGAGNDIVTIGGGDDTITGGLGNDTVKVTVANLDGSDTIDGGDGLDTIEFTNAGTIGDTQFEGLSSIEIVKLANGVNSLTLTETALVAGIHTVYGQSSTSALTVDASAFNANATLYGGSGNDIFIAGSGNDTLLGGSGNDTYRFSSFNLTQNDKIIDASGSDTLEITDAASITDAMFKGIRGVEIVKLTSNVSGQVIELGALAKAAGITTIDIRGIEPSYVTFNTSGYTGTLTILSDLKGGTYKGGSGNDVFQLSDISFDSDNGTKVSTITGSTGIDTIEITSAANVSDIDFTKTTGVEIFKFSSNGGSATLGALAKKAGIVSVDASQANSAVTVDATAMALATLNYIEGGTVIDSDFANISGFASLKFAKGDNTVTLGATAATKFSVVTLDALASVAGNNSTYNLDAYAQEKAVVFKSGAGNETFVFNDNQFDGTHTITAGTGIDTIEIADAATIFDINFGTAKITGVEVFKLSTGGSVTLGAKALAAGITTIDLTETAAANTITATDFKKGITVKLGNTVDTVTTGTYADTVHVATSHLTSADTINLGTGTALDTLLFSNSGTVADSAFTNVSNIEVIKFAAGNNTVALATNASASLAGTAITTRTVDATLSVAGNTSSYDLSGMNKVVTFKGGAGNETIILGSEDHNIIAGAGDDTISISKDDLLSTYASTIDGGLGIDTLSISDSATLTDLQFTKVKGFEAVTLVAADASQSVTLGAKATTAGVVKVDASATGSVTIDNQMTTNKAMTLIGGAGDDTFKFKSATFDLNDTVTGAGGSDVIEISDKAIVIDTDFKLVSGVETLKVGNFAGQLVTLGSWATTAGIRTVDASELTGTNFIKIDTSTMSAVEMTLKGGNGADTFVIKGADFTLADTITGAGGIDTMQLVGNTTLIDAAFAGVTDVEKLLLNVGGTYNLTLGATNAEDKAKITTIDGSKLTTTGLTLDASAYASTALTVTAGGSADSIKTGGGNDVITSGAGNDLIESGAGNDRIIAGAGDDIIISGTGNDYIDGGIGNDIFKFTNTNLNYTDVSNFDTIIGGTGIDEIWITDKATIVDTQFTKVTTTEVLKLVATDTAQTVELGVKATAAGIIKVDASAAGSVTIDNAMTTNKAMTLIGGAGADTFKFKNATFDLGDTVTGDDGIDVIEITDKATIIDTDFTKVTSVETLKIGNFAGQVVTLGAKAKVSGLVKVDASAVETGAVINASAMTFTAGTSGITLIGGKGADTLYGSSGNDIFVFSSADGETGADKVYNFADTKDKIALSGISGATAGNALSGDDFSSYIASITQVGDNTVITLADSTTTDTITLLGVEATNITVADFIYG